MGQHEAQMDRFKAQMNLQTNFWGQVKNLKNQQYIHESNPILSVGLPVVLSLYKLSYLQTDVF